MDCMNCKHLGYSGNHPVCGYILQGGDTLYIHDGVINGRCPFEIEPDCVCFYESRFNQSSAGCPVHGIYRFGIK